MKLADVRLHLSPARPQLWVWVAALAAVSVHVVILYVLRRGFDWSDEAWSYSLIENSRITEAEAWGYQHLLHRPFEWLGESVLVWRIVRYIAYGALTVLLTVALTRLAAYFGFRLRRWEWWAVLTVAQIGTFLAWSFPPRYFAYNEVTAILSQLGALAIAALMARKGGEYFVTSARLRAVIWAALGFGTIFLLISKFTSGAAFGAVAVVAIIVSDKALRLFQRLLSAVAGAAIAMLGLVVTGFPIEPFASSIGHLLFDGDAREANGHSPFTLLNTYQQSLGDAIQDLLVPVGLFALAVWLILLAASRVGADASLLRAGGVTAGVLAAVSMTTLPRVDSFPTLGRFILLMAGVATVAYVAAISGSGPEPKERRIDIAHVVGGFAIVVAPFISAFGTNMYITGQLLYASTLWATVLAIGLLLVARRIETSDRSLATIPVAFLTIFVLISATQVAGEVRNHPYRSTSYLSQGYTTSAPHLEGILLTKEEALWADWLTLQGQAPGVHDIPTLSLESPGALLIFNNSNYASPWLADFWPVSFQSVSEACDGARPDELLVLQPDWVKQGTTSFDLLHSHLSDGCGINFPEDFELVAHHDSANDQFDTSIWSLRP